MVFHRKLIATYYQSIHQYLVSLVHQPSYLIAKSQLTYMDCCMQMEQIEPEIWKTICSNMQIINHIKISYTKSNRYLKYN